jgi:hypothetical protein
MPDKRVLIYNEPRFGPKPPSRSGSVFSSGPEDHVPSGCEKFMASDEQSVEELEE